MVTVLLCIPVLDSVINSYLMIPEPPGGMDSFGPVATSQPHADMQEEIINGDFPVFVKWNS